MLAKLHWSPQNAWITFLHMHRNVLKRRKTFFFKFINALNCRKTALNPTVPDYTDYGVACDRVQAICVRIYMQFVTCCVLLFFTTEKKIYWPKKKCWKRLWEHKKKKKKTQTFEQLIICKATKKFCVRCSIISCRLRFSVIRRLQSHIRNIAANLMDTLIIFKRLNIWVYMIYNGDYLFVVSLKNRLVSHNKNCCTHFA